MKRLLPIRPGVRGGHPPPPQETTTVSSLVVAMSVEELRLFSQVPTNIRLEVADGPTASTIGGADNAVYFTRKQFAAGLRFHVQSLVKQFLHFIRSPPALIHLNSSGL